LKGHAVTDGFPYHTTNGDYFSAIKVKAVETKKIGGGGSGGWLFVRGEIDGKKGAWGV
jgi:hypothetical protein